MQVAWSSKFNHIHRITSISTAHESSKAKKDKVSMHIAQTSTNNPYVALAPLQTNELLLKCVGFTQRRPRTPRCIQLQEQLPVVPRSIQQSHCRLPRRLHRQPVVLQCIQLSRSLYYQIRTLNFDIARIGIMHLTMSYESWHGKLYWLVSPCMTLAWYRWLVSYLLLVTHLFQLKSDYTLIK